MDDGEDGNFNEGSLHGNSKNSLKYWGFLKLFFFNSQQVDLIIVGVKETHRSGFGSNNGVISIYFRFCFH